MPGSFNVWCGANDIDQLIQILERDQISFEDVRAGFGFIQIKFSAPLDDRQSVFHINTERLLEGKSARLAIHQREQVHAERALHGGAFVQIAQDDLGVGILRHFKDDAHSLAVGFIAQIGQAFQMSIACQLSNALDQTGLVDLIR